MISIQVIDNITITELKGADDNPVSYSAGQNVVLTDFYDEAEISAAASLQAAIDAGDANLFINGNPSSSIDNAQAPVQTVNSEIGDVVLDASDVGADPTGTATSEIVAHEAEADPHANYETTTQLNGRDVANRGRSNHTGTQTASTISDFDTEVSNNTDVAANTLKRSYSITDETKLAGIEANAKDDQNANEVPYDDTVTNLGATDVQAAIEALGTPQDGFTIFAIWAEENGGLVNNNRQWSFGNGSTGAVNIAIPIDCEVFAMSLDAEVGGTSVSIELMQENVPVISQLFNGITDFAVFGTPIPVTAGDRLGFRTDVETGAYTDARVSAWLRVRSTPGSTSVLNDLLDVSIGSITNRQILQFNGSNFVPLTLDQSAVGLDQVDNVSDVNKPISIAAQAALDTKIEATDIADFETSAQLDVRDTDNRNRANHTGTQIASTISDFDTEVSNNINVLANTAKRSYPLVDETKLGTIEANAQVNQTDAQIKAQYENNPDSNAFTDAEKSKLATLESSKFLGEFPTLAALQTAFPSPAAGSYANVDTGVGSDVERYAWDSDDSIYVLQLGESAALTDAQIKTQYENNPDTNAFTDANQTKLAGIEVNAKDDQLASEVPYSNAGSGISATNVQAAIDEIESRVGSVETTNSTQQGLIDQNTTENNGSVTVHSDVNNAGSGSIITDEERRIINGTASFGSSSTINANQVAPAIIPLDSSLDNNKPGLTIGSNGGLIIPANYAGHWAAEWKFTYNVANDRSNISGGIDINNSGIILPQTVAPTYNTRNTANPAGSAGCGWTPIGSLSVGDEVILKTFRAGTQTDAAPINSGETVLTLHYLGL